MLETARALGCFAIDGLSRTTLADARREFLQPTPCSSKMAMTFPTCFFGKFTSRNGAA